MSITTLTNDNFDQEVLAGSKTILIDFWAAWCGPCKMLSPIIDQIADEADDSVKICKVNVDEQSELAAQFQVRSIPTLVVIKDGKVDNISVVSKVKRKFLQCCKGRSIKTIIIPRLCRGIIIYPTNILASGIT